MSGLVLKQCPICLDAIPFEQVLFLLCGTAQNMRHLMSKCPAKCGNLPTMEEIIDNRASQLVNADVAKIGSNVQKLAATTEMDSQTSNMEERMTPILQQLEVLKEENNSYARFAGINDKYRARKKQMQRLPLADAELKEKCDTLGHFKCSYEKAMKELDQCRGEIEVRDKKACPQIKLLRTKLKGVDSVQVVPSKRLSESLRPNRKPATSNEAKERYIT
ncbi:hypothetical protein BJ912DRAFT_994388 [Pholiota molesta]|nr:hypothetical protein BJ912DRAFT_994388 [Pholiota molesta]